MECPESFTHLANKSAFELITRLCEKIISKDSTSEDLIQIKRPIVRRLRSKAYEILLNKSNVPVSREPHEPVIDLLSCYFDKNLNKKDLTDYYDLTYIKEKIDWIIDQKIEEKEPNFNEILTCVVLLQNTVPTDNGKHLYENPFSFGKLDQILPNVANVGKNDPKPYQHYPAEVFHIPFNISNELNNEKNNETTIYPYFIESFTSKPGTNLTHLGTTGILHLQSNSSSQENKHPSLYMKSLEGLQTYSFRMFEPRDLYVPIDQHEDKKKIMKKLNFTEDHFIPLSPNIAESGPPATLWELASMEINYKSDIWEEASKMPYVEKRGFISSSPSQIASWKQNHLNKVDHVCIVSEVQFILHLKYLTIGIESSSFMFNKINGRFMLKPNLCLEGLLPISMQMYISDLINIGTCYYKLNHLVTPHNNGDEVIQEAFIFKAMCDSIKKYLVWFRLEIDKIFGDGLIMIENENKRLPTLMEIIRDLKPLSAQIQTMMRVYEVYEKENSDKIIRGAGLMACLYNEITLITQREVSTILYATLQSSCSVYFRFIQRFIFEGELEDHFDEFFIKKDDQHVDSYNKRYWNKGFIIRNNEIVPEFLKGMAKYILLCGKSLRLLKLCNPDDPLCVMLSSAYPHIKCCLTFEEVESQKMLYDQYRTQCLYVCGEPITFQNLMMQKEAEKRAFREIVVLKQMENMERLIEERKRLSRMLQINKKQQFAALREAAEKSVLKRKQEKEQDIKENLLNLEYLNARDNVKKLKMEEEKKKVIAFYNEIEREVLKRQMLAEWKVKRLRLDQKRLQLITSEKLNLDRERLELQHESKVIESPISQKSDSTVLYNKFLLNIETTPSPCDSTPSTSAFKSTSSTIDSPSPILNEDQDFINQNVINSDYNLNLSPSDITNSNNLVPSRDAKANVLYDIYKSQKIEAIKNKMKVMSHEFGSDSTQVLSAINNNLTEAQRNKMRILGSNFDSEPIVSDNNYNEVSQYDTEASRQALKNKQKVLGHEYGIDVSPLKRSYSVKQREGLRLDLQRCNKPANADWTDGKSTNLNIPVDFTPSSCTNTPGDFNLRLDIETPSTFDIGPFGLPSAMTLSPTSAQNDDFNNAAVSNKGFQFPNVIEEYNSDEETVPDGISGEQALQSLDDKVESSPLNVKSTVWNFSTQDLNFNNFKPFGIERTENINFIKMDLFEKGFNLVNVNSPYQDVNDIIEKAEKKPMTDTFKMIKSSDDNEDLLLKVNDVDLSTIATCLQRSVMIPLSCQMEMVNNATLKYFLVNCDLYDHLKNIRDYFFLMDGEFAKTFCMNLFDKLNTTESPRELLNFATLHSILDKSCGSTVYGANKHAENLSFIINDMPMSFHHSSPDILECLTLSYNVAWPLNIIISQEAMERYMKVFQFLVKLRRISWILEHDSEVLKMSLKEEFMVSRDLLRSPQYHSIQLYRYIMSSLIRALHSYIFTTCLLTSWSEFEKSLNDARTLDDLYSIHVVYIKKVLFRCLLNNRSSSVMKILNDIFTVILRFHHLLNARCWHIAENEINYTHPLFSQMRDSFITFEKLSKHFYKMVTRLIDCGYQPHLAELLSVVNMNDYYKLSSKR